MAQMLHSARGRIIHFVVTTLMVAIAVGGASGGLTVHQAGGFLSGLAEGFLILFRFVGGYLVELNYFRALRGGTPYFVGYIVGALAFTTLATVLSLPWREGGAP